jgi:hypothetical protein
MSYKIAGIDVHKKVLMVVVLDAPREGASMTSRMPSGWCGG